MVTAAETLAAALEDAIEYRLGENHWQDDAGNDRFDCGDCDEKLCDDHRDDLETVERYKQLLVEMNEARP